MRALFGSLFLSYLAAFIGGVFTVSSVKTWYPALHKAAENPNSSVFGPVWFVLYTLMAVAAYRIYKHRDETHHAYTALALYGTHLVLNVFWSVAFFGYKDPLFGLIVIIALLIFVLVLTILFYRIDRTAGILMVPYLIWVTFATYLNAMIVILN